MSKKLRSSLPVFITLIAILMIVTIFLDVLKNNGDDSITGVKAIFGGELAAFGSFASLSLHFSILNLLAFFLPFVVSIIVTTIVTKDKKRSPLKMVLGSLLIATFAISVILLFQIPENTQASITLFGMEQTINMTENASLGLGAIIAIVLGIAGGLCSIVYTLSQV